MAGIAGKDKFAAMLEAKKKGGKKSMPPMKGKKPMPPMKGKSGSAKKMPMHDAGPMRAFMREGNY